MTALASRFVAWLAGTRAGQIAAALVAGFVAVIVLRAKWRSDGAAAEQAKQAAEAVQTLERVNEASAAFRADGAAARLRNRAF
jgi:L-lactate permease